MSLTINDIGDAGRLSSAAYDLKDPLGTGPFRSASDALLVEVGPAWTYIDPTSLGIDPRFVDPEGYFNNLNAQALLAYNSSTHTLAIAFRGTSDLTDFLDDLIGGSLDFGVAYGAFDSFVATILNQAVTIGATRILVTGHSSGGAMAEEVMSRYADNKLVAVTFGSPGINDPSIANRPGSDQRLINIGHVDLYSQLGFYPLTERGDAVFRQTINVKVQGSDIRVDLPDEVDYNILQTISHALSDYGQHEPYRYEYTATVIANELQKNLNDGHPFDVRAFSYVIGTDTTKSDLYGSSGANVIIGDSGSDTLWGNEVNDILDGGGGDDRLIGGGGNDTIYGGTGTDTAVYELARSQYDISINGSKIIITAKGALAFEGTDTIEQVEKFQFLDGTYTLAQLQPPTDTSPPQLTSKSPADNSTAVPIGTNAVLTFNETVVKGTGNVDIYKSDGSLFERIAVTDSSQIAFSGTSVTINPSFDLTPGTSFFIKIDPGAIFDQAGNAFAGINNQTDYNLQPRQPVTRRLPSCPTRRHPTTRSMFRSARTSA